VSGDLSDREGIEQALSAYSLAIDRQEWDRLRDAWAPDGVWILADGSEHRGLDEIERRARWGALHSPADHLHQIFNLFVRLDGDTATADSDWLYYGRMDDRPWGIVSWGHYRDRLVRTPDGWRLSERRILRRLEYQ